MSNIPLALYIHIPWCVKKCPYCDFNSHEANQPDYHAYVDALLLDAKSQATYQQGRKIQTIFFGGGTPSLLPVTELTRLMKGLSSALTIAETAEITLEANPGTVEHEPFEQYLDAGINRLSLGVQSFATEKLSSLGRIHTANDAINAVNAAKKAGFKRINIDLMHGLPNQTPTQALYDLEQAIALDIEHISWYQLTIEPNTVFFKNTPVLPVEDHLADIQRQGEELLIKAGYKNYEVSAWTKNKPCQHNINYWQFGDYLAIGAGAHGKVSLINNNQLSVYRFNKQRSPKDYLLSLSKQDAPKMVRHDQILAQELPFEFMMNALRLKNGVPTLDYQQRTGLTIEDSCLDVIKTLVNKQLIQPNWHETICCTPLGNKFLNQVLNSFLV